MKHSLSDIRHVALDMDGTIYKGSTLFAFTRPFLAGLEEMGIGYTFLTNNPSKNAGDYLEKLRGMGIEAKAENLYTSAHSTIEYLGRNFPHAKRIFALGTPSMGAEFSKAGFTLCDDSSQDEPEIVVVAFDTTLTFSRLGRAGWWIQQGKPYIATNPDWVCPTDQPTVLVDCGSICACLEAATGRKPDVVLGKPDPGMMQGILKRYGLQPHELAMVGDRTYTDVAMAQRAGAFSVLVLTGETKREEAEKYAPAPDLIVPSIAELGVKLCEAKSKIVSA